MNNGKITTTRASAVDLMASIEALAQQMMGRMPQDATPVSPTTGKSARTVTVLAESKAAVGGFLSIVEKNLGGKHMDFVCFVGKEVTSLAAGSGLIGIKGSDVVRFEPFQLPGGGEIHPLQFPVFVNRAGATTGEVRMSDEEGDPKRRVLYPSGRLVFLMTQMLHHPGAKLPVVGTLQWQQVAYGNHQPKDNMALVFKAEDGEELISITVRKVRNDLAIASYAFKRWKRDSAGSVILTDGKPEAEETEWRNAVSANYRFCHWISGAYYTLSKKVK